eukprot:TRINITY_DN25854_c0_g1_i1.p1 TRINITY_DN25854_c0_g1~~TRINITY_DN25854_c0_g1_i1.p1  ORF type:complete len:311 (+),score=125.46 TRINITY_DN25854_c0_g1_i1:53-934(+)
MPEGLEERMRKRQEERERKITDSAHPDKARLAVDVEEFDMRFYDGLRPAFTAALQGGDMEAALECYRGMQELLKSVTGFLPQWDKQRANQALNDALKQIGGERSSRKKKFSFSRPTRSILTDLRKAHETDQATARVGIDNSVDASRSRISHRKNETILIPPSPSIFLSHLDGCKVLLKPIDGSVFVQHCTNCTFIAACRQLRIHHTTGTSFYLHCSSEPIIEDCSAVGFAPYNWAFEGKAALFDAGTLDTSNNKWDLVNDFKWIREQHSPNWHIIPADKQKHFEGDDGAERAV